MKRISLLAVCCLLLNGIASLHADVQNIRLGGEIRIRGYYLANAGDNLTVSTTPASAPPIGYTADGTAVYAPGTEPTESTSRTQKGSTAFVTQRTTVTVEADLEDHVFVVISLAGESEWGGFDEPSNTAGAGSLFGERINRRFDIGVTEGYVQLSEMFASPVSAKIGRQYMTYGRGLILSSWDESYNYDSVKFMLDFYPTTVDLVYNRAYQLGTFSPDQMMENGTPLSATGIDMLFANVKHEFGNSVFRNVEAYVGWLPHGKITGAPSVPPSNPYTTFPGKAAQPFIVGLRSDLVPTDNMKAWVEGAYETGSSGGPDAYALSAVLANAGLSYKWKNTRFAPTINANYIYASGSSGAPQANFVPWFDYVEGQNGYLFSPMLSNIHVFNVGASFKPYQNTTLAVQAYYYLKASPGAAAGTNPNYDYGGIGFSVWDPANPGTKSELGTEIDAILGYDYSKDVRFQLVYALFIPGLNYTLQGFNTCANEIRGEVFVSF